MLTLLLPFGVFFNSGFKDKPVSNLSVHTLLSRDILSRFPTVGTILRVSLSNHHLFHGGVKPGDWVKLCQLLLCVVDKGSWIGKATGSTTVVTLAQDDHLVEKIMRLVVTSFFVSFLPTPNYALLFLCYVDTKTRIYDKRIASKMGHIPFGSFPSPPGLTGYSA